MSDALNWATLSAAIAKYVREGAGLAQDHVFWAYEKKTRPKTAPYIEMSVANIRTIGHDWRISSTNLLTFAPLTVSAVSTGADTLTITAHGLSNGDGPVQMVGASLPAPLAQAVDYWVIVVDANTIRLASNYIRTGGQQPLGAGNPVTPINLTTAGSGSIQVISTPKTVPAGKEVVRTAQGYREMTVRVECIGVDGHGYEPMVLLSNVVAALPLHLYDLNQAGYGVSDFGEAFSQGGVQFFEGHRGGILEPRAFFDLVGYLASVLVGYDTIITSVDATVMLESEGASPLPAIPVHVTIEEP